MNKLIAILAILCLFFSSINVYSQTNKQVLGKKIAAAAISCNQKNPGMDAQFKSCLKKSLAPILTTTTTGTKVSSPNDQVCTDCFINQFFPLLQQVCGQINCTNFGSFGEPTFLIIYGTGMQAYASCELSNQCPIQ